MLHQACSVQFMVELVLDVDAAVCLSTNAGLAGSFWGRGFGGSYAGCRLWLLVTRLSDMILGLGLKINRAHVNSAEDNTEEIQIFFMHLCIAG